jgi:hypothetical protein
LEDRDHLEANLVALLSALVGSDAGGSGAEA